MNLKKASLNAVSFRVLLSVILIIIAAGGISLFAFTYSKLQNYATEVSAATTNASASDNNLQNLQATKQQLAKNTDAIKRASDIVAQSQAYQYQDQIINDLNAYAGLAGVSIINFSFTDSQAAGGASPGTTGTPSTPSTTTKTPTVNGAKMTNVSITLKSPVDYNSFLTFLHYIEQNLTRMQVSSVDVTRNEDGSGVTVGSLTLGVYIK